MNKAALGIIGMGIMGKSLALNFLNKGIPLAVFNRHIAGKEVNVASDFARENVSAGSIKGFDSLEKFIATLEKPRKILLMVTAGRVIDIIIEQLLPFLEAGDVIMDGGNSHFKDTVRRENNLTNNNIAYFGIGISGGEEGALKGPSIMPGGDSKGYEKIKTLLELASAKDKEGNPCCTYLGIGGAGHFIKMVHNGIEYAEMQLIAEIYHLLKNGYHLTNDKVADFFYKGIKNNIDGFLIEATIDILGYKEEDVYLLDKILDKSKQKGTGSWTVNSAMDHGWPLSNISEAVMARHLSSLKDQRSKMNSLYNLKRNATEKKPTLDTVLIAFQTSRIINHLMGFDFIMRGKKENKYSYALSEVARIWTNGCIIRSSLMEKLSEVYKEDEDGWSNTWILNKLTMGREAMVEVLTAGFRSNLPMPVLSACLNHFFGMTTADSPANLIQSQRDYFGAHTYERKDQPGIFHTIWNQKGH